MNLSSSDGVIKEAREIRRKIHDHIVLINTPYNDHTTEGRLIDAINELTVAESNDKQMEITSAAAKTVQLFTIIATKNWVSEPGDCLENSEVLARRINSLRDSYDKLLKQKGQDETILKASYEDKIQEMQKIIDDLHEQIGVNRGKYEECAERMEQLLRTSGLRP